MSPRASKPCPTVDHDANAEPNAPRMAGLDRMVEWLKVLYGDQEGLVNLRAFRVWRKGSDVLHNESSIFAADEASLRSLAKAAKALSPRCPAVYATLNPVSTMVGMGSATADLILCRRWLFIDYDAAPGRGDRSSTDAEKQLARATAGQVTRWLTEEFGWPRPIKADSGNGYHALYRIELPNDQAAYELVRAVLQALGHRFNDEHCKIDPVCCNADRLTKVYGTLARTGTHSDAHPHRASALLDIPEPLLVVAREQLEAVAHFDPVKPPRNGTKVRAGIVARSSPNTVEKAYCCEGLDRELAQLARATVGDRNNQLFRSAAAVVELVNTGQIDEATAFDRLSEVALGLGLESSEVQTTLASARRKIGLRARDLSHVGNGQRSVRRSILLPAVPDPDTGVSERIDDPHRLARLYLRTYCHHADGPTLRFWNDEWHRWSAGAWNTVSDREVHARITELAKTEFDRVARETDKDAHSVSTRLVGNVAMALRGYTLIPKDLVPDQPAWLDVADAPDPHECLCAANGVIHLPTLLEHGPEAIRAISPPTPRFFTPTALSYPFVAEPPPPESWLGFLDSIWGDDPESIRALQQWFGYLITSDTSQQKVLLIIGPRRSGKGTIVRTIRQLVGERNVASPTLSALGTQFGLQPLIGKSVSLIPECRLTGRSDSQAIVERLLSISGEDPQSFDRKGISYWHGQLRVRFVLLGNDLPRLSDYSGAMASRLIVLRLTRSFLGQEDHSLSERIAGELPAILLWAMAGWQDLRASGRLLQPQSGQELLDDFEVLTNPVGAFLAERCVCGPECRVAIPVLYEAWKNWCADNGREHPGDVAGFCRSLYAATSAIQVDRRQAAGRRVRFLVGVRLSEEAGDDQAF